MIVPHYLGPTDALVSLLDSSGIPHRCLLVFVRRYYGNTYIREQYDIWVGEKYAAGKVHVSTQSTGHQIHDAAYAVRTLHFKENLPRQGGLFEDRSGYFTEVTIYCDDMKLCPQCGQFMIAEPSPQAHSLLLSRKDVDKLALYELRRSSAEYIIASCERDFCHDHGASFRKEFGRAKQKQYHANKIVAADAPCGCAAELNTFGHKETQKNDHLPRRD